MSSMDTSELETLLSRAFAAGVRLETALSAEPMTLDITVPLGLQVTYGSTRITATPSAKTATATALAEQLTTELDSLLASGPQGLTRLKQAISRTSGHAKN